MCGAVAELDADTRRLAKIVDHPVRSRIITLLGERGPLSWKELSTELGVKTGALYHHLDTLEGLVERDSLKRYTLTKSGGIVYSRVSESHTIDSVQKAAIEIKSEGSALRSLTAIFIPRPFLNYLTSSRPSAVIFLVFTSMFFSVLAALTRASPDLYFVHRHPSLILNLGAYFASLGVIVLVCYLTAKEIYKSNIDVVSMAAVSAFSFVPVITASTLTSIPPIQSYLASSSLTYTLLLVLVQVWSSALLGAGMSVASGVRIERTLPVGIFVLYVTMVLMLLQGVGP
jgi:Helix-turn-helix domain